MTELTKGEKWNFCPHHPEGWKGDAECTECLKNVGPPYYVVAVTKDSFVIATEPGGEPLRISGVEVIGA